MKNTVIGATLMLVLLFLSAAVVARLGFFPVNADGSHSGLEAKVMPSLLHASIARRASTEMNPLPFNEENLKLGGRTYKSNCAICHNTLHAGESDFGQAFYPPAPQLSGGLPQYTDAQLFWIIKHGIRNTGMPASGRMLSDEEIWQVVMELKHNP